ncbi:MAG: crotonase/enoyl-CoA hydratase family protein [Burkholderiaceae bacterium]|nr:crotonase/enoyl-CoA hydratase family protein [Burkholderiaceae bacterium]
MSDEVLMSRHGPVLVITLNRPESRNSINLAMTQGIRRAVDALDEDPALSVGIITGAGGTFCSGMDLKAFVRGERPSIDRGGFAGLVEAPPRKPLIAAVEGYALAGGFEIMLACDLIVAAQDARFGVPEVKRGLAPSGGGLLRLPRRVPFHIAMEFCLTGEMMPAELAHQHGLVNRLVPAGKALETALQLAQTVAANAPLSLAAVKRVITQSFTWPEDEMFARQNPITSSLSESQDALEGARAFAEKRAPRWKGV